MVEGPTYAMTPCTYTQIGCSHLTIWFRLLALVDPPTTRRWVSHTLAQKVISRNNQPFVVQADTPKTLKIRSGCEGGGKGALIQEDVSATQGQPQYLWQLFATRGSPPQNTQTSLRTQIILVRHMSIAGKRAGLDGAQSSLFYQAIRIIKEMRCATNGEYPRWIC